MIKHWWKRTAGLLCIGLLAFALALPAKAESKNFYFPKVHIDIQIAKDGSFVVDEFRTYAFQGRFSWALFVDSPAN